LWSKLLYHYINTIMKINFKSIIYSIALLLLITPSCKKDDHTHSDDKTQGGKGDITLKFEHNWGENSLQLNTAASYLSETGDSISLTQFNYYISNIQLVNKSGEVWKEADSYHLIKVGSSPLVELKLKDIPTGEYTAIRYTIGVDSVRNVSGAQEGALDPKEGMFWSWNTGYIFIKIEGTSPSSSDNNKITFHIGGFNRATGNNALVEKEDAFGNELLKVKSGHAHASIHFKLDASIIFKNIELTTLNRVKMPGVNAQSIANKFASSLNVDHVH
jgi:hypothetical protein